MVDAKQNEKAICLHCGGAVDEHGQTLGGDIESADPDAPIEVDGDTSPQLDETERLRDFANAVGGRR